MSDGAMTAAERAWAVGAWTRYCKGGGSGEGGRYALMCQRLLRRQPLPPPPPAGVQVAQAFVPSPTVAATESGGSGRLAARLRAKRQEERNRATA